MSRSSRESFQPTVWLEPVDPLALPVRNRPDRYGCEVIQGDLDALFIRHEDPPLEGVPHTPEASVFSEVSGSLIDELALLSQAAHAVSAEREQRLSGQRRLIANHPANREMVIESLRRIADPDDPTVEVSNWIRSLSSRQLEWVTEQGYDVIRSSASQELVGHPPVTTMVNRYVRYRNQDERKKRADILSEARELLIDPDAIDRRNEAIALITEAEVLTETGRAAQEAYRTGLDEALKHVLENEPQPHPSAEGMERWVRRWAVGEDSRAETVLRKLIAATNTPEAVTDLLYDIALAGFGTGDPQIMDRTAELLCWSTDLLPADSDQGRYKEFARYNADPYVRLRANEILDVAYSYYMLTSKLGQLEYQKHYLQVVRSDQFITLLATQIREEPDLMRELGWDEAVTSAGRAAKMFQLAGLVSKHAGELVKGMQSEGMSALLRTSGREVGPLGEWYRDNYAAHHAQKRLPSLPFGKRKVMAHLNFPGSPTTGVYKMSAGEASAQVRQLIATGAPGTIEQRTYWNTLGYLVPDRLGADELLALVEQNTTLREEMAVDKRHSLSPRGDRLIVMNSMVKRLGFDSIDYHMDPQQKDITTVTLLVGNTTFRCSLDRDYNFRETGTGNNLGLSQTAPFLEFIILSHLHQIHNTDPSHKKSGNGPGRTEPRTSPARRAHRRRLEEGAHPSEEQILIAIEEYGIDLVRQNALRLARGEKRLITWVRESGDEIDYEDPVKTKGDKASARLVDALSPGFFKESRS